MGVTAIDLNADLAEECGDDEAMYPYLSSANICCGRHAGGPEAMTKAVEAAIRHGVVIGAHVGYDDRENFGRIDVEISYEDLRKLVFDQINDLLEIVKLAGGEMKYVKPHGALYHRMGHDKSQAQAVIDAIAEIDLALHVLIPDSQMTKSVASEAGLTSVHEFFADRAYLPVGTLVPRTVSGSVLEDEAEISNRVLQWLETGVIASNEDTPVLVAAESICLHGDTPGAVASAASIHQTLTDAGYQIKSWLT
jgi:UPF0271 protein